VSGTACPSEVVHAFDQPAAGVNLRAVQLLLGHAKIGSTVQYLGVEVEDGAFKDLSRDLWLLYDGADAASAFLAERI
jgi:site-specific recombinase XerC